MYIVYDFDCPQNDTFSFLFFGGGGGRRWVALFIYKSFNTLWLEHTRTINYFKAGNFSQIRFLNFVSFSISGLAWGLVGRRTAWNENKRRSPGFFPCRRQKLYISVFVVLFIDVAPRVSTMGPHRCCSGESPPGYLAEVRTRKLTLRKTGCDIYMYSPSRWCFRPSFVNYCHSNLLSWSPPPPPCIRFRLVSDYAE